MQPLDFSANYCKRAPEGQHPPRPAAPSPGRPRPSGHTAPPRPTSFPSGPAHAASDPARMEACASRPHPGSAHAASDPARTEAAVASGDSPEAAEAVGSRAVVAPWGCAEVRELVGGLRTRGSAHMRRSG